MQSSSDGPNRRVVLGALSTLPALSGTLFPISAQAQTAAPGDLLPNWNDGPAKQAILDFVRATTDKASSSYVPPNNTDAGSGRLFCSRGRRANFDGARSPQAVRALVAMDDGERRRRSDPCRNHHRGLAGERGLGARPVVGVNLIMSGTALVMTAIACRSVDDALEPARRTA